MKKRIAAIAVMAVMALSVFAFAGCELGGESLADYKAAAEAAIQSHADTKMVENGYTAQGVELIVTAVTSGKEAVRNAATKAIVTTERDKAIAAVDGVSKSHKGDNDMEFVSSCERFSIEVSVDKTTATVGEIINVSAVFRNLTDQDITIEVLDHIANTHGAQLLQGNLQPLIEIALLPYGRYPDVQTILFEGFTIVLPAEAVAEQTIEVSASEKGEHWILVGAAFFVDENRQELISVGIPPIKISIS